MTDGSTPVANPADRQWSWQDVTLDDVYEARERIMPHLHHTPLLTSHTLSRMTNTDLLLKAEIFQKTGSFKPRGALNAAMKLPDDQKARGIITLSAGNHGQGIAFAARMVGCRAVVVVPQTAVPTKVEAIRGYGAEVRFAPSVETLVETMEAIRDEQGLTYISPYDHPDIIAGQGTVGLEILEDCPDVESIIVPIGGGGLIAGVAMAVKGLNPDLRVVGVEPEGANTAKRSLETGRIEKLEKANTIADGLAAPIAGPLCQAMIQHYVDDIVLIGDDEILNALRLILGRAKLLVEPAGAASTAALLSGKCAVQVGGRTVSILTGGNIDEVWLANLLTGTA